MKTTLKFMWLEVNYHVIIKTRSICMFRYMSHTIYLRTQVERGWLLETDGYRRTMFRMGLMHARDNSPGVSGTEPERTGRYRVLHMPVGLSIRPNRNRVSPLLKGIYPGNYSTPGRRQRSRGASTPHGNTRWPPGRIPRISSTTFVWPP